MKRKFINDMVPSFHNIVMISSVKRLCPDLPTNNQSYIINALRENYRRKGRIYKKMNSYEPLALPDLYSAYVAFYRHTYTEYKRHYDAPDMHLFKKFYNNHKIASAVFEKYTDDVKEITREMWGIQ